MSDANNITNLEKAQKVFPKASFDLRCDTYYLNSYCIVWYENECFRVDREYLDNDVGYVTDDGIFNGNFDQCLEFIMKDCGEL